MKQRTETNRVTGLSGVLPAKRSPKKIETIETLGGGIVDIDGEREVSSAKRSPKKIMTRERNYKRRIGEREGEVSRVLFAPRGARRESRRDRP